MAHALHVYETRYGPRTYKTLPEHASLRTEENRFFGSLRN